MKQRLSRLRRTFRLTTLLALIAIVAVVLSVWNRYRQVQELVYEHHYSVMAAGYTAVRAQRPDDEQWNEHYRIHWEWPSPPRMDRGSIAKAFPHWEQSLRHAQLRNHYLRIAKRPWMMFASPPSVSRIEPLPDDDQKLTTWWNAEIASHVVSNELDHGWSFYVVDPVLPGLDVANISLSPAARDRFLALRDIMPVEDGWNDDAEEEALKPTAGTVSRE